MTNIQSHTHSHTSDTEHNKQRLRDAGYKLTSARLTVLEVIEASGGHITSSDVLEKVAERDTSIGRASVFRTLDLFTRLNIIRPTFIDTSTTPYYVLMPDGHHHHIVCIVCNRVIEFDECGIQELTAELEKKYGVAIDGCLIELFGRCADCRTP